MKKRLLATVCSFVLVFALVGCGGNCNCTTDATNTGSGTANPDLNVFVGSFTSVWVEGSRLGYNDEIRILEVNSDRTFNFSILDGNTASGIWAAARDGSGIIGFFEDIDWTIYFTLTALDDGRIIAAFGVERHGDLGVRSGQIILFERD